MGEKFNNIETAVIHFGYDSKKHNGSLSVPIYQTSTFTFESAEQGEKRFGGEEDGYIYSRIGNPTVDILTEKMAFLEGGEAALAFGSGMAAVSAVLLSLTKAGDHIVCSQGLYGCTFGLLNLMQDKYNITHSFSWLSSVEDLEQVIKPETTVIYIETPINPTMKMIDLSMVAKFAKEHGVTVVVDNTFSTPYLQKPIELGCDVVVHSATKYIGGHGDVIAGVAVGTKAFMNTVESTTQKDIGGIMSPFDAWLLLRGLKTLPVRMDRHCENAEKVFSHLKAHPKVKAIYYPGDQEHPDYAITHKQMKKSGGVISFEINGSKQEAQDFLNALTLLKIAVSLGDTETLIQHPASMTHSGIPEKERLEMGITDQLIRLSVGLEAWEDIWKDIEQALNAI
ncbi:methionine gamma-lyase [Bacillus massiliigorillae]|uniref:methionine gamma-lyase n=1 Tax=Bacillus massiliigorillae TaxID=1243664 RepID=UPI0003A5E6C3|nr:methionine gamma-lyase [Bacillus massiliigorillae]